MTSFDVLSKDLDLNRHCILEASAGTGKTFSIENIVLRLLVEGDSPSTIDRILVVTFTRAATRELHQRLYSRLEQVLRLIEEEKPLPPFLEDYDDTQLWNVKRRLQRALACFHEAAILTIHGFCLKMLCECGETEMTEGMTPQYREQVVRDLLRSEVVEERYSPAQLRVLLARHGYDDDDLCRTLARYSYCSADTTLPYSEQRLLFWQMLLDLKAQWNNPTPEKVAADYEKLARCYKGTCTRSGELREELLHKIDAFTGLFALTSIDDLDFEQLITDGTELFDSLSEDNQKVRAKMPLDTELHYPGLYLEGVAQMRTLLEEASSYASILARLVADCHRRIHQEQEEEELLDSDKLLHKMSDATQKTSFRKAVTSRFDYALVDEFQDTDPIQWNIFQSLFLHADAGTHLYLVGDPKQSIYAFRNADIYTYLKAVQEIGEDALFTLDTNFRSQPPLVEALNRLFSVDQINFLPLPRLDTSLPYRPVRPAPSAEEHNFTDKEPPIRFLIAEAKQGRSRSWPSQEVEVTHFLPRIATEIQTLSRDDGISYAEQAILVRDRYQGERVARYLNDHGIPCQLRRSRTLIDSSAAGAIRLALTATLTRGEQAVAALGTRLFGWTSHRLFALQREIDEEPSAALALLEPFTSLLETLEQYGIGAWYRRLLDNSQAIERLLPEEGGERYLDEATQVVEALVRYQADTGTRGEGILQAFNEMAQWAQNDDERGLLRSSAEENAVSIMTLHASKGLEFSIVFALGVINRTAQHRPLSRIAGDKLITNSDPRHGEFLEEADAEKLRQLYVCFTRAKLRLYLPALFPIEGKAPAKGAASPMELLLEKMLVDPSLEALESWITGQKQWFGTVAETDEPPIIEQKNLKVELELPPEVMVEDRSRTILSFTALIRGKTAGGSFSSPSVHSLSEERNSHTLPAGAAIGTMLHNIFEAIPWGETATEWLEGSVGSKLLGEWHEWKEVIAEMIDSALQASLGGWSLSDVGADAIVREMEFLYPSQDDFIKGYIDAVVYAEGRYWILDWKSNKLGENSEAYCQAAVQQAMEKHRYPLQAALYAEALRRHLALTDPRPFEECFGGAYYLFLRGLGTDGIAFLSPEALAKSLD